MSRGPAVFLHGAPSTARMWEPLRAHLRRGDVLPLSLPGFGAPLPERFPCTKEAYLDWFLAELERLPLPLDLVGHDWGAIFVLRATVLQPSRVCTWAVGSATIDHEYVWHRLAQAWQTPGRGEETMARMVPERVAATLMSEGVPERQAWGEAECVDATMKTAILRLYRSAVRVDEWDDRALPRSPGLIFWGEDDPYVGVRFADRLAARTGARLLKFPGVGHWVPQQRPELLAEALEALWAATGE